jgi:hypothetical protein
MTIPSSKIALALVAGTTTAAMKSAEATAGKLFNVPLAKIKTIPGFNVRVDSPDYRAHRDMIADSIRQNGFDETKPLAGYVAKEGDENVIYVTDGHTRLDAASIVAAEEGGPAIDKLPVVVRSTAPSLTDLTVALHTSNNGRPLSPFELGVVVKRLLKDEGADKTAIAARLAVTPRYLDDVLLLVNAPKAVRTAVLGGDVSSTMAIQQLRKAGDNPEKAAEAITAAVDKAKKAGKNKATAKDVGTKMQKIKHTVSIAAGTDMKDIVKAVAAHVRAAVNAVPHATDPEAKVADVDGTISITIEVPAPPAEPVAKKPAAKKPPTKKPAAAAAATAEGDKPKPRRKKAAAAAAPAAAPATGDEENIAADDEDNITADDDLGIEGAEEVTSEGADDEPAIMPPAVKNGEGVGSDEETDI